LSQQANDNSIIVSVIKSHCGTLGHSRIRDREVSAEEVPTAFRAGQSAQRVRLSKD
jgi:hypothetical protein